MFFQFSHVLRDGNLASSIIRHTTYGLVRFILGYMMMEITFSDKLHSLRNVI